MVRRVFVITICGIAFCNLSAFADGDPIKDKLDEVKAAYEMETDLIHDGLLTLLEEKQAAAKKAGNLATSDKLQAEIDAFENDEALPKLVPTRVYKREMVKARKKMEDGYIAARKAYLQADKTDDARAIDKELEKFKAPATADSEPELTGVDKKCVDASRLSMKENPMIFFYVCEGLPGEQVLRATRKRYTAVPNGKHPEEPAHPLNDVLLSVSGAELSDAAVGKLVKMCDTHNAAIKIKKSK